MSNGELFSIALEINEIAEDLERLANLFNLNLMMTQPPEIDTERMLELVQRLREINLKLSIRFGNRIAPAATQGEQADK